MAMTIKEIKEEFSKEISSDLNDYLNSYNFKKRVEILVGRAFDAGIDKGLEIAKHRIETAKEEE